MLRFFRVVSLLEGSSYLLILCVTLEFISREFVHAIGMGHGVLFLGYLVIAVIASYKQNWSGIITGLLLLAAIIPFAFLAVDFFLRKEQQKTQ